MSEVKKEDEFELTFLAKFIPLEINNLKPQPIVDFYLPGSQDNPHLRLRRCGGAYEITKKAPVDPSDVSYQTEQTIPLSQEEFSVLSRVSDSRKVSKDRYRTVIDGHSAEVDIFTGDLAGLVMIDFEFPSNKEKAEFQAPGCCLVDVTQNYIIAGNHLAGKAYRDIKLGLSELGYNQLA